MENKVKNNYLETTPAINVVEYRFINVKSLKTDESINIGVIINKSNSDNYIIKLVNNLGIYHSLFPIFDIHHANQCLEIIKAKYKIKKIKNVKMDISKTISLSDVRIHTEFSTNNIEEIIYQKYFTLSKTENFLMSLYKLNRVKEDFFKCFQRNPENISSTVETVSLIRDMKHKREQLKSKLLFDSIVIDYKFSN